MKILTIGNFGTGWDGSICDEEHIAQQLEWMGHEVYRLQREDATLGLTPEHPKTDLDFSGYDFTLVAQWDGYGDLSNVPKPLVYWAFDYQAEGQEWHELLIQYADLYLSKRIADSKYTNWQWLSQDFAPMFMGRHYEKPKRDIDVLFTGSYLPWATKRNTTLKAIDEQFNLVVHSVTPDQWVNEGFKNVFGPVMDRDYTGLVARAKINISIDHTLEAGYWSDRTAQIMACGGFVMMRYIPLAETVFRDKIVYFYGVEDCLEKIAYYLNNDLERMAKGSQGYEFAQANLMVKNRVKDLLTIVESIL